MKERFLKLLYRANRSTFYYFFEEEFLYDMPADVREPAMTFLAQGREKLERWALFMSKFLQHRMVTDPDKIKEYQGMMLMLRLFLTHVNTPILRSQGQNMAQNKDDEEKSKDPLSEVKEALRLFKDGPKEPLSTAQPPAVVDQPKK